MSTSLTDAERRALVELLYKQSASRALYIPIRGLKHLPDYKGTLDRLLKKGLISFYKAGECVGLTKDGKYVALVLTREERT